MLNVKAMLVCGPCLASLKKLSWSMFGIKCCLQCHVSQFVLGGLQHWGYCVILCSSAFHCVSKVHQ